MLHIMGKLSEIHTSVYINKVLLKQLACSFTYYYGYFLTTVAEWSNWERLHGQESLKYFLSGPL